LKSISDRVSLSDNITTSVSILDTGINYNNMLLSKVCCDDFSVSWHPDWPKYDQYQALAPFNEHGSLQAGLAAFGNLMDVVLGN
ncbi:S8 family serine peptidase, partial [Escherichia coli]|nr:S8 family serine peptidase [Escherichia coli]